MATVSVYLQAEFPYKAKFDKLADAFKNSVSLKMDIGKILKSLTQETFSRQTDPWGNPWKPSKRVLGEIGAYSAWVSGGKRGKRPRSARGAKLTGNAQTLVLTGRLRNSFEVVHAGNEVFFASKTSAKGKTGGISNVVYFPAHQFGVPKRNLVPRPMMPINNGQVDLPPEWEEDISGLVMNWLKIHAS